jgi:hypothetical protein
MDCTAGACCVINLVIVYFYLQLWISKTKRKRMKHIAPKRSNTSQDCFLYTHILRCQLISDISKGKHCHYSQMCGGFIVEVYLQVISILGTRYREVSHTPAVVPPCKKLCPLHRKLGVPPGGSNMAKKKNSPLPLEIQSGFSSRAVCKLVSTSTERPSSHRTI